VGGPGSGARPGERRGGRGPGGKNKYTRGKEWMRYRRTQTLDGTLQHLTNVIAELVPNPVDRQTLGEAFDLYVAARERATAKQRRSRSVATGVPPEPPMPTLLTEDWQQLLVTEVLPLKIDPGIAGMSIEEMIASLGHEPKAFIEAALKMPAEDHG
jgi:hypothetical protein